MHTQYHLKYKNIRKEVVVEVRNLIKAGFFKAPTEQKITLLQVLHTQLCRMYSINSIPLVFRKLSMSGNGMFTYGPTLKIILYKKASLVTYLHEFKHYLQYLSQKNLSLPKTEEEARGWSISLFYLATPKLCKEAIKSGKIIHQKVIEGEKK